MSARFRCRDLEIAVEAGWEEGAIVVRLENGGTRRFRARRVGSAEFVLQEPEREGVFHTLYAVRDGSHWWINLDGRTYHLEQVLARGGARSGAGSLTAPTPATVQEILVHEGAQVTQGQVLLVLSAMKMQIEIKAPHAGTVHGLGLAPGDKVDGGVPLLRVETEAAG